MNNHSWYAVLIYTIYLRTFCSLAVDLLETWAGKVRAKAAWAIPGIGQCTAPLWDSWWVLWSFSLEFLRSWWSELDEGWREICRKPLHLMVTTLISCRWSYCIINITKKKIYLCQSIDVWNPLTLFLLLLRHSITATFCAVDPPDPPLTSVRLRLTSQTVSQDRLRLLHEHLDSVTESPVLFSWCFSCSRAGSLWRFVWWPIWWYFSCKQEGSAGCDGSLWEIIALQVSKDWMAANRIKRPSPPTCESRSSLNCTRNFIGLHWL